MTPPCLTSAGTGLCPLPTRPLPVLHQAPLLHCSGPGPPNTCAQMPSHLVAGTSLSACLKAWQPQGPRPQHPTFPGPSPQPHSGLQESLRGPRATIALPALFAKGFWGSQGGPWASTVLAGGGVGCWVPSEPGGVPFLVQHKERVGCRPESGLTGSPGSEPFPSPAPPAPCPHIPPKFKHRLRHENFSPVAQRAGADPSAAFGARWPSSRGRCP